MWTRCWLAGTFGWSYWNPCNVTWLACLLLLLLPFTSPNVIELPSSSLRSLRSCLPVFFFTKNQKWFLRNLERWRNWDCLVPIPRPVLMFEKEKKNKICRQATIVLQQDKTRKSAAFLCKNLPCNSINLLFGLILPFSSFVVVWNINSCKNIKALVRRAGIFTEVVYFQIATNVNLVVIMTVNSICLGFCDSWKTVYKLEVKWKVDKREQIMGCRGLEQQQRNLPWFWVVGRGGES